MRPAGNFAGQKRAAVADIHVPLLCDITPKGELVELGVDPAQRVKCSQGVQADLTQGESLRRQEPQEQTDQKKPAKTKPPLASAAVCRLALGLLGLAPHEKPNTWAEVWLSFQDTTCKKLGLSSGFCSPDMASKADNETWQRQVLSHLRQLLGQAESEPAAPMAPYVGDRKLIQSNTIHEHLDLAEFALKRITCAVKALQDPERLNRPMLLQEYTEEMAEDVCQDLRQWLEQLSVLLSLYHVFLLEAERERRRLSAKIGSMESKWSAAEVAKKHAERCEKAMEDRWNEHKLRRRAEAVLGISLDEQDDKIYSQKEVDAMFKDWEEKYLKPLQDELEELRESNDKTFSRMASTRSLKRTGLDVEDEEQAANLGRAELGLLQTALVASADRVAGELSGLLLQLGESLADGSDLQEIVQDIMALPALDPRFTRGQDVAVVLSRDDLGLVQTALNATSQRVAGELSRKLTALGEHLVSGSPELSTIVRAIQSLPMDVAGDRRQSGLTNSVGVNTSAAMVLPSKDARDFPDGPEGRQKDSAFQAELGRMRASLDAELKAAKEEAERQRIRAEEAMRKLEEEAKKAENIIADLRSKLKALQALLERAGLSKEAAAALSQSGLKDFIAGRDVFERLYRDALRRMRVYAETQLRLLNMSAADFLQTLHDLAAYPVGAVEAAIELQRQGRRQGEESPLLVMGYAGNAGPSPAASPKNVRQDRQAESADAPSTARHLRKFKTSKTTTGEVDKRSKASSGTSVMKRAATEGSSLRGVPIRTLRQTLFEGFPEQGPPKDVEPHGRSSNREAIGDPHSDPEGRFIRPVAASQLLPRPGTGSGHRSPLLANGLHAPRPASSGRAKVREARQAHPSMQAQSRSFG